MSTFLSYSEHGALVGGFRPLSLKTRGGEWTPLFNSSMECNTPAFLHGNTVIAQDLAYKDEGRSAFLRTSLDPDPIPRKASKLYAGGGRWVAQYEQLAPGVLPPPGQKQARAACLYDGLDRTLFGEPRPDHPAGFWGAGQHHVGYDGTLAYTPKFHAPRGGVIVEDANRQVITTLPNVPVTTTFVLDRNAVAVFSAGDFHNVWIWNGLDWWKYALHQGAYDGALVRWRGQLCAITPGDSIYIQPLSDKSKGWVLGRPERSFNGIGWTSPEGDTFIAWSENAGASVSAVKEEKLIGEPQAWPTPPAKPIPLPSKIHAVHRAMDGLGGGMPGSMQWGDTGRSTPIVEGMPYCLDIPFTKNVSVVLYASDPNGAKRPNGSKWYATKKEEFEACLDEVKSRNLRQKDVVCALGVYCDEQTVFTAEMLKLAELAVGTHHVPALPIIQGYPKKGDTLSPLLRRVRSEVSRLLDDEGWPRVGLMLPAYLGGNVWPLQLIQDWIRMVDEDILSNYAEVDLLLYFGAKRPDGLKSVVDYVAKVEEHTTGRRFWFEPAPPKPSLPPVMEEPVVKKSRIVAFRRNFDTPLFLRVESTRRFIEASPTLDANGHFELFVFDHARRTVGEGQFGPGQKVLIRSAQDEVNLYPGVLNEVETALWTAGIWEVRAGEFPNTYNFLVPSAEEAITVDQHDGDVTIEPYKSSLWSLHDFEIIDAHTGEAIHGPF